MKTAESTYLTLLRAGLWDTKASIEGDIDWKSLVAIAKCQSTMALVCHAALQMEGNRVPAALQTNMQALLMKSINAHATTNRTIARIVNQLREQGIEAVLLKGQGVASYYPTPLLRQCGDIDLYVGKDHYEAACRSIRTKDGGRKTEDDNGKPFAMSRSDATEKHTEFDLGGGLSLEIHEYTEVLNDAKLNARYQTISDAGTTVGLSPIVFDGVRVQTPEDTFNAFYIFHHLWHHTIGMGMGLRQVCDWTVFLRTHAGQLDEERLKTYLHEMNLLDEWQVYGSLAVQHLGLNAEEMPFYDRKKNRRAERLLHYILTEGDNRDFKFGRSEQSTQKKAATLRYIFRKAARLLPIFPSEAMKYFTRSIGAGVKKAASGR